MAVGTGPAHGSVNLVASGADVGKFTYTPAAGYTGPDSFTYTISNGVAGGTAVSVTGTVSITIGGPVIWFVDPNVGANGNGTLGSPFKTLAEAITAIGTTTGQKIFIYSGGAAQSGNFILKGNGWLVGQAAIGTSFDNLMGIAPPLDTAVRPNINNGTKPALSNGSGSVVTLADNNTILGVAITGGASGAAVVSSGTVNTGLIGNATTSDVTIAGAGGGAFSLGAGNGAFNLNASITSATGRSVNVTGRTGGTVGFTGAISDTGTGISLTSNTGATINFSGGITSNTGANTAFTATGGGTANVTGTNTIGATTALTTTAVNIANTTIGGSGITFKSISSNGGANGIILDSTGSSGGFTVTGTVGSTSRDNSGGTIQNKTGTDGASSGHGIYLNSTANVSLNHMNILGNQGDGIYGNSVTGFTLTYTSMATNGTTTAQLGNFHGEGRTAARLPATISLSTTKAAPRTSP